MEVTGHIQQIIVWRDPFNKALSYGYILFQDENSVYSLFCLWAHLVDWALPENNDERVINFTLLTVARDALINNLRVTIDYPEPYTLFGAFVRNININNPNIT